jgi:hypothetical protein
MRVCTWQAFPAQSNICGQGQEPTIEWSTSKVLRVGKLRPYPQTLDSAGKACQGQTLQLITNISKLQKKCFITLVPD